MKHCRFMLFKGLRTAVLLAAAAVPGVATAAESSRDYPLAGFAKVDIAGIFDLELSVGGEFSVRISGDEKDLERLRVRVEEGVLILDRNGSGGLFRRGGGLTAVISMPALTGLEISGVVDGRVTGITGEEIIVDITGVSDLSLSGECGVLTASVSGIGDLDAKSLRCEGVEVDISGIAGASVHALRAARANVSGLGDVNIHGSPPVVVKHGSLFSSVHVH